MEPVKSYFARFTDETPLVTSAYWSAEPGFAGGWVAQNEPFMLDASMVRFLRQHGATTVAMTAGGRTADFRLTEMASEYVGLGPVPSYG
jgi:hypothetical protein